MVEQAHQHSVGLSPIKAYRALLGAGVRGHDLTEIIVRITKGPMKLEMEPIKTALLHLQAAQELHALLPEKPPLWKRGKKDSVEPPDMDALENALSQAIQDWLSPAIPSTYVQRVDVSRSAAIEIPSLSS